MTEPVWLYGQPVSTGVIKSEPEDFCVQEDLGFSFDGEGEHVLVYLRKTGCNTQFVADALAKFARISARAVSYAGLKDRHAVTEQWFCLQMPGKETPDFSRFKQEGCEVLKTARHRRKLRIGALKGNRFTLVLRQISHRADVEARLEQIQTQGVPNYFGEQRFGRSGNNLIMARKWANDEIVVKERGKRSFYLSAARSAMFNQATSARIESGHHRQVLLGDAVGLAGSGSWFTVAEGELESVQKRLAEGDVYLTAPLPGDGALGSQGEALALETKALEASGDFLSLMTRERVAPARRALIVVPESMTWRWLDDETLRLGFELPAGSFATSVVRELVRSQSDFPIDA